MLTLALLTAPAIAGGVTASADDPPSVWAPEDQLVSQTSGAHLGTEVDIQGDTAVATVPGAGQVSVYERSSLGWHQAASLSPPDASAGFGDNVALSQDGTTLAVSAPWASSVHVYELDAGSWTRDALLTADGTSCFGKGLALDGDTILVGAPCDADKVVIFEENAEGWNHIQTLSSESSVFGWALAIDEGQALVGSLGRTVEVLTRSQTSWSLQAKLDIPSGDPGAARYGWSVDLEGDRAVVGSPSAGTTTAETGAVHVFESAEQSWTHEAVLTAADLSPLEPSRAVDFGADIALDGDRLVVGAPGDDRLPGPPNEPTPEKRDPVCATVPLSPSCHYPGAAYIFEDHGTAWHQEAKLTAPDGAPTTLPRFSIWSSRSDAFGTSVAIDGPQLAVGAPNADAVPGDDAGATYLYTTPLEEGE